jgi:hypothetical protein
LHSEVDFKLDFKLGSMRLFILHCLFLFGAGEFISFFIHGVATTGCNFRCKVKGIKKQMHSQAPNKNIQCKMDKRIEPNLKAEARLVFNKFNGRCASGMQSRRI